MDNVLSIDTICKRWTVFINEFLSLLKLSFSAKTARKSAKKTVFFKLINRCTFMYHSSDFFIKSGSFLDHHYCVCVFSNNSSNHFFSSLHFRIILFFIFNLRTSKFHSLFSKKMILIKYTLLIQ